MIAYEQVEQYMKEVGLKYIKTPNDFIAGLAIKTDKKYAQDMAYELNSRGEGAPVDNAQFYELKNRSLDGSIYVSAAFDGGVFRHIGNLVIDDADVLGDSVLDMCCDCGIVTCFMAKQFPDKSFVGVDINEKAIENAKELAGRFGLNNVEFICCDAYELDLGRTFSCVTSFRSLLDVCEMQTQGLNFLGYRPDREENYKNAFMDFAKIITKHLDDNGSVISVERYTSEYGWLGWMMALNECGLMLNGDKCKEMMAQDISGTKSYSVTYASKTEGSEALEVFNAVMSRKFKSGTGYDGGMAEFALYYDSEGEIEFTDVIKGKRTIHQYAFATSKNGKRMYFDCSKDSRKIKYYNEKKEQKMLDDYEGKIKLYDAETFEIVKYKK
ncbi:MAG: class I SAM-dependent methyltransferase [Eubacterium sp.]|nr:class I SAM-dependent methyltransferase [Eubacterium sp.]